MMNIDRDVATAKRDITQPCGRGAASLAGRALLPGLLGLLLSTGMAAAQQAPAGAPAPAPAGAPAPASNAAPAATQAPVSWWDALKLSGHIEAGITVNPDSPSDGINFGHLFTDRANTPLMNQLMLTAERPIDPKATDYDFGFRLQGLYGTDARYTHALNELDRVTGAQYQIDLVEANLQAHLPVIAAGGIDVKLGEFASPMSAESIDATQNSLYSHSYIFNYGVPFKHTGVLATAHLTPEVDLYLGLDTGVNAFLGAKGTNDHWAHGQAGFGLTLLDGNLTVLALTHIGPELPQDTPGVDANSALRYLNDMTVTWKINDALTSITDLNFIHDDGLDASGGGVAQYLVYQLADQWSLIGRGEIWRDDKGAFVGKFPGNLDYIDAARGLPNGAVSGGSTTYGALTFGVNYKPPVPKVIEGFVVRPEIRFDQSLNGTRPFNNGTSDHQFTMAVDVVMPF